MKTLVVDRSTDEQSLALVEGEVVVAETTLAGTDCRSGDWVLKVREFAGPGAPDRIVVGTGPGSFAGIRAALAFAQGYALGSGCEVLGLPSPCAYASAEGPLAVVGDARRERYWIALFDGPKLVVPVFQVVKDQLELRVPLGTKVVSPDEKRIGELLKETFADRFVAGAGAPKAGGLARAFLANPKLLKPEPLPIYLNPAVRD